MGAPIFRGRRPACDQCPRPRFKSPRRRAAMGPKSRRLQRQTLGDIMNRRAVIVSALLILAGAAWRPAQAGTEIAFGITSNTALSLTHYVATEKKYYEAEDLKVDTFVAGSAVGVLQQLAAGSLNMAQAATDQSLRAIFRGAPIRIVAGAAATPPLPRVAATKTPRRGGL